MKLRDIGVNAGLWLETAGDATRQAGRSAGAGLEKTGKKLREAGQATGHAALHPKETATDAGQAIARKSRTLAEHTRALGREIDSRNHIPEGLPKPPIGGRLGRVLDKEPIGPNAFEAMSKADRKGKSPNYPVQYSIPAVSNGQGIRATGRMAGFTTGPGLLPQEYRVPGRFDYDGIPNFVVTPHKERDIKAHQHSDTHLMEEGATSLQRVGRNGLPAHPETGMPVIPPLPGGSFTLTAQAPMPRRPSALSLDTPTRNKPRDPYAFDDSESRPGTAR